MTRGIALPGSNLRCWVILFAGAVAMLTAESACADLIVAVQHVTAAPGASGAGLDVTLTNSGPGSVAVGGFSFELTVGDTAITFTDVTTATTSAPYIFDGLGLVGPNIGIFVTGQDIQASDVYSVVGSGTTLGSGASVGLGHLVFDVSASAAGVYPVLISAFPGTSLADFDGNDVPITTLSDGSISVSSTSVPEPTSFVLLLTSAILMGIVAPLRRRRRG